MVDKSSCLSEEEREILRKKIQEQRDHREISGGVSVHPSSRGGERQENTATSSQGIKIKMVIKKEARGTSPRMHNTISLGEALCGEKSCPESSILRQTMKETQSQASALLIE